MAHRGQILGDTLRKRGVNFTKLAGKLPWTVKTIYRHIGEEKLAFEKIAEYARAIHYPFTKEFPELEKYSSDILEEKPVCKQGYDLEYYRTKYEQIMEKYNHLLEKYNELIEDQLKGNKK